MNAIDLPTSERDHAPMRWLLALALVACSPSPDAAPAPTSASCGPTPPRPLSSEKCFGPFLKNRTQSYAPRGPNYVPPGCPCAEYVLWPEDGEITDGREIPIR